MAHHGRCTSDPGGSSVTTSATRAEVVQEVHGRDDEHVHFHAGAVDAVTPLGKATVAIAKKCTVPA